MCIDGAAVSHCPMHDASTLCSEAFSFDFGLFLLLLTSGNDLGAPSTLVISRDEVEGCLSQELNSKDGEIARMMS